MIKHKTLTEFLDNLSGDKRAQVEMIRDCILASDPSLKEHIKWNAPSYIFDGEDRITFNVMNKQGLVKLVLHMGATRKENKKASPIMNDETGLIEWSSDIRGMITFNDIEDIIAKQNALKTVLKNWLLISARN